MTIKELILHLERGAPRSLQEDYDNSGPQVGDMDREVGRALICLDVSEAIVQEAIEKKCDLIISHHPLIFKGLDRLIGGTAQERIVQTLIKHDIAVFTMHTNLDNVVEGVNGALAAVLGLKVQTVLRPKKGALTKLVFYCPADRTMEVLDALFAAGAGRVGQYDECSFRVPGTGTFRPLQGAQPFSGQVGERSSDAEERVEVLCPTHGTARLVRILNGAHPYEEVAYDLIPLENEHQGIGAGTIGQYAEPMHEEAFLRSLKEKLDCKVVRHSRSLGRPIQKVAICGGSGGFLIPDAKAAGVDAFVTGDLKYHQFQDADGQLLIVDAGHYETERATMALMQRSLAEKFPTFATHLTELVTNHIHYF